MTPQSTTWSPFPSGVSPKTALPHDRLAGLIAVRWWALATLLLIVAAGPRLLDAPLPQPPMLAILSAVGVWNGFLHWQLRRTSAMPDGSSFFLQFCVDLLAFAALLFFSGGATNPLVFMLLLPVVLSALLLSRRAVVAISALAIMLYSLLMVQFVPLELGDAARAATLHLTGMWLTFVVSAAMLAWFVMRTTNALRRRDAELARAREQTYRDERVLALGALAAGAAHELGSPLATLAVLVGEFERDAQVGSTTAADLKLMREQIAYCKRIITRLTERAGDQRSEGAESMRCDAWMEGVHAAWRSLRGDCESAFTLLGCSDTEPPVIVVEPTLGQSVVSVLDNALRAGAPVDVALDWNDEEVRIEIRDNGPGFSEDVLRKAGRQTFGEEAQGYGIGLLLASASLDRVGGRLELDNPWTGGARVVIRLPLKRIGVHA